MNISHGSPEGCIIFSTILGPVVQSIVSLMKSLVSDSLSSSAAKIKCANIFC